MSSEEETGLQTQENTGQETDSQTETGTPEEKGQEEKVDWEKRYKDLQTDHTTTKQRLADAERQAQEREEAAQQTEEETGYEEEGFVDRKTMNQAIEKAVSKAVSKVRMQTADSYFRRTYPELVKHENIISGILRNPKDSQSLKGASAEERIDAAVKEFNELTEEAITSAKAEAETEAKEREEKNRKATGLGESSTTPSKSEDGDVSDEQELKNRKAQSAKRRGLA